MGKLLPDGWCHVLLGDVLVLSKEKIDPNLCPESQYLSLEHISTNSNEIIGSGAAKDVKSTKNVFQAGDLLYGKLRPYLNKVCIPNFDGVCSTDVFVFKRSPLMLRNYLLRLLTAKHFVNFASMKAKGINLPRLGISEMSSYPILLPPLNEQKRIVAKIEALQARSRAVREALADVPKLVEQFKQSVLAAAFRGDLTKSWREQNPDVESADKLLERICTERRQKWEADQLAAFEGKGKAPPKNWRSKYKEPATVDCTDLPELARGWAWSNIDSVITAVDQGWSPKCEQDPAQGNDWAVMKTTAVQPFVFNSEENKRLPDRLEPRGALRVQEGDLIITRAGPRSRAGVSCLVRNVRPNLMICDKVYRVRFCGGFVNAAYIEAALNSPGILSELDRMKTGISDSGVNLTQAGFRLIKVPFTSIAEQHQITQRIESLFSYADSILEQAKASLEELNRLDQSILAKAFRGELVPQDPTDEPASVLLERIKAERTDAAPAKRSRNKVS